MWVERMAKSFRTSLPRHVAPLCGWVVFCFLNPIQVWAENAAQTPLIDILYGAYEIVGRLPGDTSPPYRGWIRLAVEGDKLSVDRCIAGRHSEGEGMLTTRSPGIEGLPVIKISYAQNGAPLVATCAYQNDFDNLPRLSCHTYLKGDPEIAVPGLESAYPIIWPVPIDYFNCF
jgi:hypothetical protein